MPPDVAKYPKTDLALLSLVSSRRREEPPPEAQANASRGRDVPDAAPESAPLYGVAAALGNAFISTYRPNSSGDFRGRLRLDLALVQP